MFKFLSFHNTPNGLNIDLRNDDILQERLSDDQLPSNKSFICLDLIKFLIDMGYLWIFPDQRASKH